MSDRYLKILHLKREEPSLEYLKKLVKAQLQYVPYENISKVLRFKEGKSGIPEFEEFLELNEQFGFGGTCYIQNGYFVTLLNDLGFQAEILGSGVEAETATHPTCRVHVNSESYIVDLGNFTSFAGPFSLEPGTVLESKGGVWTYRFQATNNLTHEMRSQRGEEQGRTSCSHPQVRELSFFESAIQKSFGKEAMFMNTIVCYRMFGVSPVYQWGSTLVEEVSGEAKKTNLTSLEELERAYRDVLHVPKYPVKEVALFLRDFNGIDIFKPKEKKSR